MSKNICEVCGSSYAETATQCPICGTAKTEGVKPAADTAAESGKGGKFMRNNKTAKPQPKRDNGKATGGEDKPSNLFMIIIVAVLLVAIIAVCVFIANSFGDNGNTNTTGGTITTGGNVTTGGNPTDGDNTTGGVQDVPCISLTAVENASGTLTFVKAGDSLTMKVSAQPADTTDVITYESMDKAVATVNENGVITAVANGTTTINAICGTQVISVEVKVEIPPEIKFELNRTDITLSPKYGLSWNIYSGNIDPSEIKWESNSEAVKVENGVVTAVANTGNTPATITATYGDIVKTAKVHVTGMTPYALTWTWKDDQAGNSIYAQVGEKITFYLIDRATGAAVTGVTWERSADAESYGSITLGEENEKGEVIVTCVSATEGVVPGDCVRVIAKYTVEGETYTHDCYIYIKPAATENT